MADEITYAAPIGARTLPGATSLTPTRIVLDLEDRLVEVRFSGANGVRETAIWKDDEAVALIRQLNTLDLSTRSLKRRVIERALADGKLPAGGTVS